MNTKEEQKKNSKEFSELIENLKNPTQRDIDYLEGVLNDKNFHHLTKKKLQGQLEELKSQVVPERQNAMTFETPEPTKPRVTVVDVAKQEIQKTVASAPSDRTTLFTKLQKELYAESDKYTELALQNRPMSSRLTKVAKELKRLAKNVLRV